MRDSDDLNYQKRRASFSELYRGHTDLTVKHNHISLKKCTEVYRNRNLKMTKFRKLGNSFADQFRRNKKHAVQVVYLFPFFPWKITLIKLGQPTN